MKPPVVWRRLLITSTCLALLPSGIGLLKASDDPAVRSPNYALASQWTAPKMNKLVFDTQVVPHWLEFSDRFWYSYETRDGKRYMLADPSLAARPGGKGASVKAPLFDHAKMAAMLASATLVPMDAQHLPIKTLKFVNKDTALRIEVEVPKDADVPGLKKKPVATTTQGGPLPRTEDNSHFGKSNPERTNQLGQLAIRHRVSRLEFTGRWTQSRQAHGDLRLPTAFQQVFHMRGKPDRFLFPGSQTKQRADSDAPKSRIVAALRTIEPPIKITFRPGSMHLGIYLPVIGFLIDNQTLCARLDNRSIITRLHRANLD